MATNIDIVVNLYRPVFHGLRRDGRPDWPPSPLRMAGALMAGCHANGTDPEARSALAQLVRLNPPDIWTPSHVFAQLPDSYRARSGMPTSAGVPARLSDLRQYVELSLLGFSDKHRVAKPVSRVVLSDTQFRYRVADPNNLVDLDALNRAARRIPYFGRSEDQCDVTAAAADNAHSPGSVRWCATRDRAGRSRGWTSRSLEWMDSNYETWASGSARPPLPAEPYSTALQYDLQSHSRRDDVAAEFDGRVITVPLIRSRKSHEVPDFMSGLPRTPDVQLIPCVTAGSPHSDGRLMGVAVAGTDETLVLEVAYGLARDSRFAAPGSADNVTLNPRRWTKKSRVWMSATPLRAFPDERVAHIALTRQIQATFGQQDFQLSMVTAPALPWQHRWRQQPDGLTNWWITASFTTPVGGPLVLGEATLAGYGLLIPGGIDG